MEASTQTAPKRVGRLEPPPTSTPSLIEQHLRDQIFSGKLKPGTRVKQQELASRFNVSRMPVREALRSLEGQGLLCGEFHKGYVVSPQALTVDLSLRLQPLRELYSQIATLEDRLAFESEVLSHIRPLDYPVETPFENGL